jgi:hypothetical protein
MPLQTSVEWLDSELWKLRLKLRGEEISLTFYFEQEVKLIEQAKEMHKEEITEAHLQGLFAKHTMRGEAQAEQYYTQTYNT